MAKQNFKIVPVSIGGVMANQEFNAIRVTNQVGDRFLVPTADWLLVLGTEVPSMDRNGNAILDDRGNPQMRSVGQHFPVLRLIDGVPTEVVELYVGQVVKTDYFGRIAYPNALSDALRKSSDAFKKEICGNVLEITDEKEITDRVWDQANNRWMRDSENEGALAKRSNRAFKFEVKRSPLNASEMAKATEMLVEYYQKNYPDVLKEA